jgi:hypothetical protein
LFQGIATMGGELSPMDDNECERLIRRRGDQLLGTA